MYKVVIIGAGNIASGYDTPDSPNILTHAHAISSHASFMLCGFYDKDYQKALKAAHIWGGRAYPTLEMALPEADVVICCVPDSAHGSVLKEIAPYMPQLVVVEKPVAVSMAEAKQIQKLYAKRIPVIVNYSRRFMKEFEALKHDIHTYGKFCKGTGYYGKGILHNGSHMLDLLRFLMGDIEVEKALPYQIDDFGEGDVSRDAILNIQGSPFYMTAIDSRMVTIFELELFFETCRIRILEGGACIERYHVKESKTYKGYKNYAISGRQLVDCSEAMQGLVENIKNYLEKGEALKCTLEDGVNALAMSMKIWGKREEGKPTILFFARDPGGANAILPVYQKMKERYHAIIYAKDFGLKMLGQENIFVHDIDAECNSQNAEQIMLFLSRLQPDIVITGTSLNDYTERFLWRACDILHIKSFAVLDQWMNLGIRFSEYGYGQDDLYRLNLKHSYLPYKILVMDEIAKQSLVKDGVEENRVCITGQPHFDVVAERYERAEILYGNETWNVIYVSEPIIQDYDNNDETNRYWGYNERSIFFHLYHSLQKLAEKEGRRVRLVIRPHPRENTGYWEELAGRLQSEQISLECDRESDSFDIIKSADLICGMSSMFLLEAVICHKPIVSIMIGLKREKPFVLDEIGICKGILSEEELYEQLKRISNQESPCLEFGFVKDAAERVCTLVEGEMSDEKASDSWRK